MQQSTISCSSPFFYATKYSFRGFAGKDSDKIKDVASTVKDSDKIMIYKKAIKQQHPADSRMLNKY